MVKVDATKVSVVVPVFNVQDYVGSCVASILQQSHEEIELILVDDGSTDSSSEIVDELALEDARVTVFHTPNRGVSAARNSGLELATGAFVTFVDADDVLARNFISSMLTLAWEFEADMVISTSILPHPEARSPYAFSGRRVTNAVATAELLYPRITIGCWNKLFSRQFLRQEGLHFSTALFSGEGQKFVTDAAQRAGCVVLTEDTGYYYRIGRPGSAVTDQSIEKWLNGLRSIEAMRSDLVLTSRALSLALDFHEWETAFLGVVHIRRAGLTSQEARLYRAWRSQVRRLAPKLAVGAVVSPQYRLSIGASAVSISLALFIRRLSKQGVAHWVRRHLPRRYHQRPCACRLHGS